MKKALLGTAMATAMLASASGAQAETYTGYVGLDYQAFRFDASGMSTLEPQAVAFKLGGSLNEYFKIEGRMGRGTRDANNRVTDLMIENFVGAYVKGGMDVMDIVYPYFIAGFSKFDLKVRDEVDQTEDGISYGVGAEVHAGRFLVGFEWMQVEDNRDFKLDMMSITYGLRF